MTTSAYLAIAAAASLGVLASMGCKKEDANEGKLLVRDKLGLASTEFELVRARDIDRYCESLYLRVPAQTQLHDATDEAKAAFADIADVPPTPTEIRRWDYILMNNRHSPQSYEAIFIGQWRPGGGQQRVDLPDRSLFMPVRCVVTMSAISIFELEPPYLENAGSGASKRSSAIVAKYTRVPASVGADVQQRTRQLATADKANVGETAAISIIVKEAPAASGSSSPE
jgi:hypothetical protein